MLIPPDARRELALQFATEAIRVTKRTLHRVLVILAAFVYLAIVPRQSATLFGGSANSEASHREIRAW